MDYFTSVPIEIGQLIIDKSDYQTVQNIGITSNFFGECVKQLPNNIKMKLMCEFTLSNTRYANKKCYLINDHDFNDIESLVLAYCKLVSNKKKM